MDEQEARAVLGLDASAGLGEARRSYRSRARLFHPDALGHVSADQRTSASESMARLNDAWSLLQARERQGVLGRAGTPGYDDACPSPGGSSFSVAARPPNVHECWLCGSAPAAPVTLRTCRTLVLSVKISTVDGSVCRACGLALYAAFQRETLTRGWWGVGLVVAVPALVTNWFAARSLRGHLRPAYRDLSVVSATSSPMPPMRRVSADPLVWIAPAGALALVTVLAVVLGVFVGGPSSTAGPLAVQPPSTAAATPTAATSTPTYSAPAVSPYDAAPETSTPFEDVLTPTPSSAPKDYMSTCWTQPDENDTTKEVPCGSDLAYFQVVSITADTSDCGDAGYLTLVDTGDYGCVEQR